MFDTYLTISWIDYAIVVAYIFLMLGVGVYVYRKAPTFEQYLLAGRSLNTPVIICTLASTYYGLDVLFGTSEVAYNDGVVAFFGYSEMSIGIYIFAAFALSKRLRDANFTSLPEILERNYGASAAIIAALGSIAYSIPTTSLFALGRICEVMFGLDARIGAFILGSVALAYTLLGGLMAVAVTDTIQFILMCLTVAVAVPMIMNELGGFTAVAAIAPEGYFYLLGGMPVWLMLAYAATGISILVDPGFYQRIFAARSGRQARNAMLAAIIIWLAYDWLVTAGGMLAATAVAQGLLPADLHSNDALLAVVTHVLPTGLVGIFLAGVLATAMSTIDSYTLVAGANMSYDIYRPLVKPDASDRELVKATKIGIVLSWVLGYVIAFAFSKIMALLVFVTTILTATVLVPILVSIYWKGKKTAMAGLLSSGSGLLSVIVFYLLIYYLGDYNELYGTFIWTFSIAGESFSIWQEYSLFFSLPVSVLGFLIGNTFGPDHRESLARELAAT
jgi:SSS family solute:Na+ symporter